MSRRCPIKALEVVRPLGMRPEALLAAMVIFAFMTVAGWIFTGLIVAVVAGRLIEKSLKDKAEGFLIHAFSQWVGTPSVRSRLPQLGQSVATNWRRRGLLPPPSVQDTYEP